MTTHEDRNRKHWERVLCLVEGWMEQGELISSQIRGATVAFGDPPEDLARLINASLAQILVWFSPSIESGLDQFVENTVAQRVKHAMRGGPQ